MTMVENYLMDYRAYGARLWGMLIHELVQPFKSSMKPWTIAPHFRWQVKLPLLWPVALLLWHQQAWIKYFLLTLDLKP